MIQFLKKAARIVAIAFLFLMGFLIWISAQKPSETAQAPLPNPPSTPSRASAADLLANIERRISEGNPRSARAIAITLLQRYPGTEEAEKISARLSALDDSIAKEELAKEALQKAEAERLKSALASLHRERDEVNAISFYTAKDIRFGGSENYFGLYLSVPGEGRAYIRWQFKYTGDDWLFIRGVTLNVDGERLPTIEIPDSDMGRDNSGGSVWEWYDKALGSDAEQLLFLRLASAKKVIVRYEGRQYYRDRILSDREKKSMAQMIVIYSALNKRL